MSKIKNKLYKPIKKFKWKDATKKEMEKEAIPHYKKSLNYSMLLNN